MRNLRSFVDVLRAEGELVDIQTSLDSHLVIPEIQRRVVAQGGPALFFHNVKGSSFPAATNLFGSHKRIDLAFGGRPQELIRDAVHQIESMPPKSLREAWRLRRFLPELFRLGLKRRKRGPLTRCRIDDATQLPALTCWPEDGGPFVTLPLVYTEHPETGVGNLGMYRVQIQGPRQVGMHIQIHRGGGNHYYAAEANDEPLPVAVFVGGPPALIIAAIAPLPEDVPELVFASLLMGAKLEMIQNPEKAVLPLIGEADFCVYGHMPPHRRAPEGPFGDHYGYYSLKHDYPLVEVEHVYHRPDAIFPATVVGRPPQEDHFIAVYLQDLLSPLFPLVLKGVKDVFAYEESGVHSVAGAVVRERYYRESFAACLRIMGEGQLSLTKVLLATDGDLNVRQFRPFLEHIVARCDFRTDLHLFANISLDTLDYTGPAINQGSKALFLGTGPAKFELSKEVPRSFSCSDFGRACVFCPGVLVVAGPAYVQGDEMPQKLLAQPEIAPFRLVFLHDDPEAATASDEDFLWHIFTRFEPAGDIYGRYEVIRHHLAFEAPLVIDCRMKPGYPKILEPDPATVEEVDRLWPSLGLD